MRQEFVNISRTKDASLLSPGYMFLSLMDKESGSWGPRIYDDRGDLVWYGSPSIGNTRITDFHVCDHGQSKGTHLCWHDQDPRTSPKKAPTLRKVWIDHTYSLVHNITTLGNQHEFHVVDDGNRFVTMDYKRRQQDLRPYCGAQDGWIFDACALEYDLETAQETWRWCFTDQLPVYTSNVYFQSDPKCQKNDTTPKGGHGTEESPWDVAHLNSVDKNSHGDFLVSFRHLNEIMLIAGPHSPHGEQGTILWRLGGGGNQFEKDFTFSRQHMARFVGETNDKGSMTIALFNNAWEGFMDPSSDASSGQVVQVNTRGMRADLLQEHPHPNGKLCQSRGSMQMLPNDSAFVGWGTLPEVSEFSPNGTLLLHAQFAPFDTPQYSYRAFKQPWVGRPHWPPKLLAYSSSCGGPTLAYVSWNGATEVHRWRFFTKKRKSGIWQPSGDTTKHYFETKVHLYVADARFVLAEALDVDGKVLGSVTEPTFVPDSNIADQCEEWGCTGNLMYDASLSAARRCNFWDLQATLLLVALLALLEYCMTLFNKQLILNTGQLEAG